jgi:hypothetical protein
MSELWRLGLVKLKKVVEAVGLRGGVSRRPWQTAASQEPSGHPGGFCVKWSAE